LFGTAQEDQTRASLEALRPQLEHLSRASVRIADQEHWPSDKVLRLVTEGVTIGIGVEGDVDLRKILDRIGKQKADAMKEVARLQGKLGNAEFVAKAPPEVVTEHRQRIGTLTHEQSMLAGSEEQLRRML
jgi:valyl-tRNA synthetase